MLTHVKRLESKCRISCCSSSSYHSTTCRTRAIRETGAECHRASVVPGVTTGSSLEHLDSGWLGSHGKTPAMLIPAASLVRQLRPRQSLDGRSSASWSSFIAALGGSWRSQRLLQVAASEILWETYLVHGLPFCSLLAVYMSKPPLIFSCCLLPNMPLRSLRVHWTLEPAGDPVAFLVQTRMGL